MSFTITTAAVEVTRSGTSFTIDVTAANLSEDLNQKDFTVLDLTNGIVLSNTGFTKTSQTILSYSGSDIGTNIILEVRRTTPISRFQTQQFGNKFDSVSYNEETDRILGKIFEMVLFGTGDNQFFIPSPKNEAYAASWAADTIHGRTANVIYDELELCPRLADNETITGTRIFQGAMTVDNTTLTIDTDGSLVVNGSLDVNGTTADFTGATNVTRTTPATATNNTEIATTAFVRAAIDEYVDTKFVGAITHFEGTPPTNWLLCDGSTFTALTYPKLNTYLGGNTLPNYQGRMFLAADGSTYTNGATGGSADAVVVQHNHGVTDPGHTHTGTYFRTLTGNFTILSDNGGTLHSETVIPSATTGITVDNAGVSGTGANLPPYKVVNVYIYAGAAQ